MKHLIGIRELGRERILQFLRVAEEMAPIFETGRQPGRVLYGADAVPLVDLLFLERSIRTWGSFQAAARLMGMDSRPILGEEQTSMAKGETFANLIRMLTLQQGAQILVIRTKWEGASRFASRLMARTGLNVPVINAGDGSNSHPSQTLLDLFAILRKLGRLEDFTLALCGDIRHSRVAHGLLDAAALFGFRIGIFAAPEMRPPKHWLAGVSVLFESEDFQDLAQCDGLYLFRSQFERIEDPVERERAKRRLQFTTEVLDRYCKPDIFVMHAQPIDPRDGIIQLYEGIFRDPRWGFIHDQAAGAVPVRMAILKLAHELRFEPEPEDDAVQPELRVDKDEAIATHFASLTSRGAEIFKPTRCGTVIDHLPAGRGSQIYSLLSRMAKIESRGVIAMGVRSRKLSEGRKDVVMLEEQFLSPEVMATITMLAPAATFNVMRGDRAQKIKVAVPAIARSIFSCPNPLCITNNDPESGTRFSVASDGLECRRCERTFVPDEIWKRMGS